MSSTPNFDCWGVIIDTDSYAGNFERQMCAHCTGYIGDCEVGEQFRWNNDIFDDAICFIPDDYGCGRPCSIYPSPNKQMNSVVIYFLEKPTEEQIKTIKERSLTFPERINRVNSWIELSNVLGWGLVQYRMIEEVTEL